MLDDQEGDALVAELLDAVDDHVEERRVDAAGRLVEQEEARTRHQPGGEVHQLLLAVGELRRRLVGEVGDADEIEELHRRARAPRRGCSA